MCLGSAECVLLSVITKQTFQRRPPLSYFVVRRCSLHKKLVVTFKRNLRAAIAQKLCKLPAKFLLILERTLSVLRYRVVNTSELS